MTIGHIETVPTLLESVYKNPLPNGDFFLSDIIKFDPPLAPNFNILLKYEFCKGIPFP